MQWIREKTLSASEKFSSWKDEKFGQSSLSKSIGRGGDSGVISESFSSRPNLNTSVKPTPTSKSDLDLNRSRSKYATQAISSDDYFKDNEENVPASFTSHDKKLSLRRLSLNDAERKKKKKKRKKKKKKKKANDSDSDSSDSSSSESSSSDSSDSDDSEAERRRKKKRKKKKKKKRQKEEARRASLRNVSAAPAQTWSSYQ
eukprot:CAMPEP_0184484598 /NCGR_PEP_ID=MMETSP0113_2-20130426/6297_1 /TAXON_ID=91329 /ORGANISM="Norrisiella sphaerica, Strain BC52" /LENGTH=200 /DNA_ID=CAMNT_0026865651 /DNA_START=228 /DNA_END=830 /DNA_ORIENTATION=-